MPAKKKNYLSASNLLEEIYKSIDRDELTENALKMLMQLANRTQRKLYYSCVDDKEHALSEAYLDLWKRWRGFNPYKARRFKFEIIEPGKEFKFYRDINDRSTITKCKAIDHSELFISL